MSVIFSAAVHLTNVFVFMTAGKAPLSSYTYFAGRLTADLASFLTSRARWTMFKIVVLENLRVIVGVNTVDASDRG